MKLGLNATDYLRECSFQEVEFACTDRTWEIFDKGVRKCFLVELNQTQAKKNLGFRVRLVSAIAQMASVSNRQTFAQISAPFDPFSDEKLLLHPGYHIKISIRKIDYQLLNAPKSQPKQICKKGKIFKNYNQIYTSDACEADCIQEFLLENCACRLPIDQSFLTKKAMTYQECNGSLPQVCVEPVLRGIGEEAHKAKRGLPANVPLAFQVCLLIDVYFETVEHLRNRIMRKNDRM